MIVAHSKDTSSTVYLRKLAAKERPLELCLQSDEEKMDAFEQRQFLLRENDTGEILVSIYRYFTDSSNFCFAEFSIKFFVTFLIKQLSSSDNVMPFI